MKRSVALPAIVLALAATLPAAAADKKSEDYRGVYAEEITSFNYLVSSVEIAHKMFANLVDGLTEYDRYGLVKPALATSWSVSDDGLSWTFKLRQGVKWMTSGGKEYAEVVAQDFVDAAKYVLTSTNASKTSNIVYDVIAGAKDFYDGKTTDFAAVGVKAKGKYELEYRLIKPTPYFLSMLTYVCFMPANGKFLAETGDRFGTDAKTLLYNGAYVMTSFEPMSSRELSRNEKYWDRSNVHIKRLVYKYNKEAATLGPELFLRGEINDVAIPGSILDTWMKDPARKAQIHPALLTMYSYFYSLNFDPKFDEKYEPANWKVAVNDKAFRKSLFHALDREAALLTSDPYSPKRRLLNTLTPPNFVAAGGKDYVQMGTLAAYTKTDSFNKAKALEYKAQAMKELAGKATFPVKIVMPYNSGETDWVNRSQVVEQQLEALLGKDYVDVIPEAYPPTGFLTATRRAGKFALQECRWGPDYADPMTYTDPFRSGTTYNKPELAEAYLESDGKFVYDKLVAAANAEVKDLKRRYELFAKAEAFLLDEAIEIPYAVGGGGFEASKLEPFTQPFAPFGVSSYKFKGRTVLGRVVSPEEYDKAEAAWAKDRAEALKKAQ